MKFKSEQELYDRILPALTCKISELKRKGISFVREKDIYNMLKSSKWIKEVNLTLSEMVSDIMNLKLEVIEAYFKEIDEDLI
ncbi:MAG TPA: post-transcriptional regulator [Bacilli bacterium]|nr:post-transcriptional regulator [Bacilli bacterium]